MAVHFRPRLAATLAACAAIAATLALGRWQLERADYKAALMQAERAAASQPPVRLGPAAADAQSLENRQVEAYGRFEPRGLVLLDNRVRNGQAGYEVIMPLRLGESGMHVLVNRGWVRAPGDRSERPALGTPEGEVHVVGLAVVPGRRIYELSSEPPPGPVWQNVSVERYRARMPYAIQAIMIRQTNDLGDGLLREWPTVERSVNVHRSYAVQWFAMAAVIAVVYLYFSLRRVPPNR